MAETTEYVHVSTNNCPWCKSDFIVQKTTMLRITELIPEEKQVEEKWEHTISCEKGHNFDITMTITIGGGPRYRIRVPRHGPRGTLEPVETKETCVGKCGGPIMPGELYTGGAATPRHIGC